MLALTETARSPVAEGFQAGDARSDQAGAEDLQPFRWTPQTAHVESVQRLP
jgi:hypothetical protein